MGAGGDVVVYLLILALIIFIVCMLWKRKENYGDVKTLGRIPPSDARNIALGWYRTTSARRDVDPSWVQRMYDAKLAVIRYNNNHLRGGAYQPSWQ